MPGSIVITGGNQGLGLGTAKALRKLAPNAQIVLACRDSKKGEAAAKSLSRMKRKPICMTLDLASLDSVRSFAKDFANRGLPPLSALICNAGLQIVQGPALSRDGYELTFAVNHLGHFLLANLLLPQLEPDGRIVFVSSGTHDPAMKTGLPAPRWTAAEALSLPAEDGEPAGQAGRRAYATSKLCNVLCTYEFARRMKQGGSDVSINAFDPGLMPGSGLARQYPVLARLAWNSLFRLLPLVHPNVNTPARSGRNLARLAIDPAYTNTSGRYFDGQGKRGPRELNSSTLSYDEDKWKDLWQTSALLARMTPDELPFGG